MVYCIEGLIQVNENDSVDKTIIDVYTFSRLIEILFLGLPLPQSVLVRT